MIYFKKAFKLRWRDMVSLNLCCSIRSFLPESTRIVHPFGISIGENVLFGENCVIFPNVSIGRRWVDTKEQIVIGNNVIICTGSVIVGVLKIGDDVSIGANSVVLADVPANTTVVGVWKKKRKVLKND